jgi:hypothetical protein
MSATILRIGERLGRKLELSINRILSAEQFAGSNADFLDELRELLPG